MRRAESFARAQQGVVLAVLFGVGVVMLPGSLDPVMLPKLTVALIGAVAVAALWIARTAFERHLTLPATPVLWAAGAFLVGAVVATVVAEASWVALLGQYRRGTGLLLYLACVVLLAGTLLAFDRRAVERALWVLLAAGAVNTVYGLLQVVGWDPVDWEVEVGRVAATMGNPNFAAAYLGIVVPVAAWGLLRDDGSPLLRAACGILGVGALGVALATRSIQGPLVAVAGLAVVLLAWVLTREGAQRRAGVLLWGGGLAAGGLAVVAGLAGAGPLARFMGRGTVDMRLYYWEAAVSMFADRPVLGVGMDMFGGYFRSYRPEAAFARLGPRYDVDAPHNVVLGMFANGGLLLGVTYLAVVALTAWALVRGFRRLEGQELLLLGGLGGAWLAFQLQSLVSIDLPALAVTHWILAGAIVVLGWAPGARTIPPASASASRKPRRPKPTGATYAGYAAAAAVLLVGLWAASAPLRADRSAGQGLRHMQAGDGDAALAAIDGALETTPRQAEYWALHGEVYGSAGLLEPALESYEEAVRHDPLNVPFIMTAARLAEGVGQTERTAEHYTRAVAIDRAPRLLVEAAEFWMAVGEPARAAALAEEALEGDGRRARWWALLGHARSAIGAVVEARAAYERALALDADLAEARAGLERLDPEGGGG